MRRYPVIRAALLFAAFMASLTLVVWRQSRALQMLGDLEVVRSQRASEEARRAAVARELEALESRARVGRAARERLGMRLPSGSELIILPLVPAETPQASIQGRTRTAMRPRPPSDSGGGG